MIEPAWGTPPVVETAVRWESPVEGIVDYAREAAIDLIVIATHGRTGLSHVLLGSVAERIVREAPCPVLTIRDRDRPRPSGSLIRIGRDLCVMSGGRALVLARSPAGREAGRRRPREDRGMGPVPPDRDKIKKPTPVKTENRCISGAGRI